ncbi:hypothetical protein ACUODF_52495, partial [Escherichia coli]
YATGDNLQGARQLGVRTEAIRIVAFSLLLMGPQWRSRLDREASLLGHSGCRIGGNDLDIALAFKNLMPLLGMGGETEKGIALPILPWWNAVAI